ncbi:MAG: integrase [Methylophaga sp.]|nr:MAG: integrase [Methylophaga sp.]
MALTDIQIRNAKPKEKQYKLSAGLGLYLIISPNGGKWWRVRYRFGGKQKEMSVGTYPEITLKAATLKRDEFRAIVSDGLDPLYERKMDKIHKRTISERSFEAVAREWHSKFSANWSESHSTRTLIRLEQNAFPWLGNKDINDITAPELLSVLRRVENRGALETAHRVNQICGQVFRYAIATGRAERDPAADLKGALPPTRVQHHASITEPVKIGALMRAIKDFSGTTITATALKLSPLIFVRPGELRQAEWSEIDLDNAEWRLPPEKMKMRVVHIVPLSKQAIAVLKNIEPVTGRDKYVFPSNRTKTRPMSNNTVNAALRRMGYTKEEMTAHGFRSMASTILNEQGWNRDAIERQLAHGEKNGVRAAYNYAQYLPERKKMMQSWADYLDGLASGADVVPINRADKN